MSPSLKTLMANLRVTPVELAAVRVGVKRTRAIWKKCDSGIPTRRYSSPEGMPTADDAIRALDLRWTRQVKLLDLALMIAAAQEGRSLGNMNRTFVA